MPEVVWGRNAVAEALRGRRSAYRLWVVSGPQGDAIVREFGQAAATGAAGHGLPHVSRVDERALTELAGTPDHQGVVAEMSTYPYAGADTVLSEADLVIALDRVQDPHNLGAIIRTAHEAGAGVAIPRHRAVDVTPAVVKASAGATEHADVVRVRNLSDFLQEAKRSGFWVYGAESHAEAVYSEVDYAEKTVLVVGSEGFGLGDRVKGLCDLLVSIPLHGRVGSLNVSVAAGILLFEVVRQRNTRRARRSGGP